MRQGSVGFGQKFEIGAMQFLSKLCISGCVFFSVIACDSDKAAVPGDQRIRGVLAQMSKLEGGVLYFTLQINGVVTDARYDVTGPETRLSLPASDLRSGANSIRVEFYFKPGGAEEILIADSVNSIDTNLGNVFTLAGLDYRYADSDSDTIINAHELMQSESDPDRDSIANYLDIDSDNDGVTDGLDFSPYGDTEASENNSIVSISYRTSAGVTARIDISSIAGDTGVLSDLTEDQLVDEFLPPGWPMNGLPIADINTRWTAIEISAGSIASCSEWRISRDTSSISSSLSRPAFGVFQRSDDSVILIPLTAGEITDLSLYRADNTADGDDTVDNSLIAVLVTPNTAGWLSLYSQRGFTGEGCYLNNTYPAIY